MFKRWFLILGAYVAPLFSTCLFSVGPLATVAFSDPEAVAPILGLSMAGAALPLAWFGLVAFWCLYDLITGGRVPANDRMMRVMGWLFFNIVAVWAYVFLFVWREPEGESVAP